MGAGRKAARGMKAWLGLRDTGVIYQTEVPAGARGLFGIDPEERNHARIRIA
jgi:hypothetical protein